LTTYHTPGVYFERRDNSSLAIGLPRADITGFAGIAMRGPLLTPVRAESWKQFLSVFGDYIPQAFLAYSVYGFFANGGRTAWISRVADENTARKATANFGTITVTAGTPGTWGNEIYVEPILSGSAILALRLLFPDGTEDFRTSPFTNPPVPIDNLYGIAQDQIDRDGAVPPLVDTLPLSLATTLPEPGFLSGGADGLASLTPQHFLDAFEQLGKIPEIGLMVAPDLMPKLDVPARYKRPPATCCVTKAPPPPPPPPSTEFPPAFDQGQIRDLQIELAGQAASLRYRFAILDGSLEIDTPADAMQWRNSLPHNTSFAATYYPWICVNDPLRLTGLVRPVPASGHIAGIFSRSDRHKGVHKPPMNAVLEAVSDVRTRVDDNQHGVLNESNVNVIRVMPGRGIRLMGARTLWDKDILLRYVNVRRLLSTIEKALDQSLSWTVFEPNNPHLWSDVDRTVRNFLETLFSLGMLEGATSEDAYYVRCDESTNPPSETDLGKMTCEIGVQPPYPAEFVVVTIGLTKDGVQVSEGRDQSA
jgi:hypothetical protein